jgi:hypothetical protein
MTAITKLSPGKPPNKRRYYPGSFRASLSCGHVVEFPLPSRDKYPVGREVRCLDCAMREGLATIARIHRR